MPASIITVDELTLYGSRSVPMDEFSGPQLAEAIDVAVDRIRQAALNEYTALSFELVTEANAPDDLRAIAKELALGILTDGDAGRPQSIIDGVADANRRLGFLSGGKTSYDESPGSVLIKIDDGVGGSVSSRSPCPERKFDRENSSQKYNLRDGEI